MRLVLSFELAIPVVERLSLLQEELADPIRQLGGEPRWTSADRLQVPVRIIELAEPDLEHRMLDGLKTICRSVQPFDIEARGTRMHPAHDKPRMVLTDVDDPTGRMTAMLRRIDASFAALGITPEPGDPTPVILVGRIRCGQDPPRLRGVARPYSETPWGASPVRELVLTRTGVVGTREQRRIRRRIELGTGR